MKRLLFAPALLPIFLLLHSPDAAKAAEAAAPVADPCPCECPCEALTEVDDECPPECCPLDCCPVAEAVMEIHDAAWEHVKAGFNAIKSN